MGVDGTAGQPYRGAQRFIYLLEGTIRVKVSGESYQLEGGHFAYIPADTNHGIKADSESKLLVFEKPYSQSNLTQEYPTPLIGNAWEKESVPFLGDEDARLRVLLPDTLAYDMAVNLFTFQSGVALPFVETHIMEHGLYLLEGQGIYRLDESWYPIQAGDALWMGSYCPQWFCAIGKTQSTYIYYKDVNRDPLSMLQS